MRRRKNWKFCKSFIRASIDGIVRDTSTTFLFDECVKCKINKIRLESFGMNCWVWKVNKIDTRFRVIFCCCFFFSHFNSMKLWILRWTQASAHTAEEKKKIIYYWTREIFRCEIKWGNVRRKGKSGEPIRIKISKISMKKKNRQRCGKVP